MGLNCTLPSAAEPDLAVADWDVPHVTACHSFLQGPPTAISPGERPRRTVGLLVMAQMRSAAMSAIWSLSEEKRTSRGHPVFVDAEVIRGRPLQEVAGHGREAWRAASGVLRGCCDQHFVPAHNPRALMCYCVRNLYVTIRATMLAKISSAGRDFRIIGLVECRVADRPG
jgi:hypothetical protein